MKCSKTSIFAALLALATGGVQAAHLQLLDSTSAVFGSSQTTVNVASDSLSFDGTVEDLSGLAEVLAFGSDLHTGTLPDSGLAFSNEWVRLAALDASSAVTRFQATGSSSLSFDGAADLGDAVEAASIGLSADLLVASDGEAAGTPVDIRLQLSADSLFSSSVAGAEDTPTFNLLVLDSAFNPLASYNGVALGGSDTLDLSFSSAVGQTLSFSLSYGNALSAMALP